MADMFNTFRDPVYWDWYRDVNGNKTSVLRTNETHPVVNNYIVLMEIPDEYYKVQIDGMSEIPWDKPITNINQYKVFYTIGWIEFHPDKEAQLINITKYYSKGICYIPASRIYTEIDDNGNIEETMQQYVNSIKAYQYKDIYNDIATYNSNNQVYYEGSTYICKQDGVSGIEPTNSIYWGLLSAGFNKRGNYSNTTQYYERDIVWYDSTKTMYICKQTPLSAGVIPTNTTYWEEFISVRQIFIDVDVKISEIENRMATIENDYSTNKTIWDNEVNTKVSEANNKIIDIETRTQNIEDEYINTLKPDILTATQNANDKAQLAQTSTDNANLAATNANTKADLANTKALYADTQGDYAKLQGDYALEKGNEAFDVINHLGHEGDYDNATTYYPNNVVFYEGSSYMNIQECQGILPTNASYWELVAKRGNDAVGLFYGGTWSATENYTESVLVSYDGKLYSSKQPSLGIEPTNTDYWDVFLDNINIQIKSQTYTTTEEQTEFNLSNGTYRVGQNMVNVYVGGIKQPRSAYIQSSPTQITLKQPLPTDTFVEIEYIETINVGTVDTWYEVSTTAPTDTNKIWIDIS